MRFALLAAFLLAVITGALLVSKRAALVPAPVGGGRDADPRDPVGITGSAPSVASPPAAAPADSGLDDAAAPLPGDGSPHWLVKVFAPRPGESMNEYRDRVVPIAQAVIEPQRLRVGRTREQFARDAHLDDAQLQALDGAVAEAALAIRDRVFAAVLTGEIGPRVKPQVAVALARDILDHVDGATRRFDAVLSEAQREELAASPFDVADYLLFSTRWESLFGVEPTPTSTAALP